MKRIRSNHKQAISELADYVTINPVNGAVTIPMSGKKTLKVRTTVTDGADFAVVVTNPAAGCEIFWELTYTNGGAVTYTMSPGSTSTWKGGAAAPSLTAGKTYRMAFFFTTDNVWHNASGGEW